MKKYIAEFIGTCALVTLGCGTAMLVGCDAANGSGYLLTALAFGLTIVGMAYCVGNISGCHINPAVSLGVLMTGGMSFSDFIGYVIAQCLGALAGSGLLALIFSMGEIVDLTGGYGSNGLAGVNGNSAAGCIVEIVLTFFFVLTILGVTNSKAGHGSFAGVVIGFTLVLIHILGIGLTGTSVNPARSLGPAIVAAIDGNSDPISCVWVFILAPLVGAAIAACVHNYLNSDEKAIYLEDEENSDSYVKETYQKDDSYEDDSYETDYESEEYEEFEGYDNKYEGYDQYDQNYQQ